MHGKPQSYEFRNYMPAYLCAVIFILSVTSCEKNSEKPGLADIDGNVYETVVIGNKVWMAENLRVTRLNDGTAIPMVESDTAWSNLKSPGYSWYGNYRAFFMINHYGALYNWYTVKTGRLCPAGWHVPDTDEWYAMLEYLGYDEAGGKLKATGTRDWLTPNTGANNETGFNALPGGFRNAYYNDFQRFRSAGYFWHSNIADAMRLNYNSSDVTHTSLQRNDGASVRCVKD